MKRRGLSSIQRKSASAKVQVKEASANQICNIIHTNTSRGIITAMVINEAFRSAGAILSITSLALNGPKDMLLLAVSTLCSFAEDYGTFQTQCPDDERDFFPTMAKTLIKAGAIDALAAAIGMDNKLDSRICVALATLVNSRWRAVLASVLKCKASLEFLNRFVRDENISGRHRDMIKRVLVLLTAEKSCISVRCNPQIHHVL